jgi:hypothetical protein
MGAVLRHNTGNVRGSLLDLAQSVDFSAANRCRSEVQAAPAVNIESA